MTYHMVLPFVVALIKNNKGEVLIGRMPNSSRKPYPLNWNLPGGKLEDGESPEECIKREILEELGLKSKSLKYLGVFHHSKNNRRKDCKSSIPSLGLCYEVKVTGIINSVEDDDVHFASISELKKLGKNMTPWTEYFLKNYLR